VLQCVAVCCSVLQCVAVCCSVLQCVAVCCSVLQCVALCCSVLQCVAVCCSVSHMMRRSMMSTALLYKNLVGLAISLCGSNHIVWVVSRCMRHVTSCESCRIGRVMSEWVSRDSMLREQRTRHLCICVAACCSALQCVAARCSALQCHAVCYFEL